jgi:hypothetical protein
MRRPSILTVVSAACLSLAAAMPAVADVEWHGFLEAAYGLRTTEDASFEGEQDYTLQEARAQLRLNSYGDRGELFSRLDFLQDGIRGEGVDVIMREGFLRFSEFGNHLDVKAGRQALTWGTGDLVFINDLFPKDWVSFFIGREDQYLKAPVDAVRLGIFGLPFDVDVALIPKFTPDILPSGERLSYYEPEGVMGAPIRPEKLVRNGELAIKLSRYVGSVDFSLYGYQGFYKTPQGLVPRFETAPDVYMAPFYPELRAYGASARGSGLGGVLWGEAGYYDSLEDQDGVDPFVPNSSLRFLGGIERQVMSDFNVGFQYYGEWMMHYDEYLDTLAPTVPRSDELRQLVTLRAEKLLRYQTVRLSMFTFYSPTDEDAYVRGLASYRLSDEVEVALGGNLFAGENAATQFAQFDKNDNVYGRLRYNF